MSSTSKLAAVCHHLHSYHMAIHLPPWGFHALRDCESFEMQSGLTCEKRGSQFPLGDEDLERRRGTWCRIRRGNNFSLSQGVFSRNSWHVSFVSLFTIIMVSGGIHGSVQRAVVAVSIFTLFFPLIFFPSFPSLSPLPATETLRISEWEKILGKV